MLLFAKNRVGDFYIVQDLRVGVFAHVLQYFCSGGRRVTRLHAKIIIIYTTLLIANLYLLARMNI